MSSHAVSRGHPAPLVGKIFFVGGSECILIFAWIHALFRFILLTYNTYNDYVL